MKKKPREIVTQKEKIQGHPPDISHQSRGKTREDHLGLTRSRKEKETRKKIFREVPK